MALFSKYNIKDVTGINSALSSEMANKIELWNDILNHEAEWFNSEVKGSGVAESIGVKISKPIAEELDVSSENELLNLAIKKLNESSTEIVTNAVLCGSSVIRPIFASGKIQFEIIRLGNYIPTSYSFDGTLTSCVIVKKFDDKNKHYVLLEKHEYKNRKHSINMELYSVLGESGNLKRCRLIDCPQTAELTETYTWEKVDRPMIIEIRNRKPNNVDNSNVPVAIYSMNENLIEDADKQYARMNWEQESAERKVFLDEDLLSKKIGTNDKIKLSARLKKMFVKINGSGIGADKIETFNPEIRTAQQKEAFQEILKRLELVCGLGKGGLSDLETMNKTATQDNNSRRDFYTTVDSIESELEEKYHHCAWVFAYMLSAFLNVPFNDEIEITFNDIARKDVVLMRQEALQELNAGILNKWEYRMKFYGEDEETAKLNVPESENGGFVL